MALMQTSKPDGKARLLFFMGQISGTVFLRFRREILSK
jgi:hypothetical protein